MELIRRLAKAGTGRFGASAGGEEIESSDHNENQKDRKKEEGERERGRRMDKQSVAREAARMCEPCGCLGQIHNAGLLKHVL